jgi:hypothetical protein
MNLKLALFTVLAICMFSGAVFPVFAEDFNEFRITGPHSQDHYLNMFGVMRGDPINIELKLSRNIGFWNPQGFQWINTTIYDVHLNYVCSQYTQTDEWKGVTKLQTFTINTNGTYILVANYTNKTHHCFAATAFFVL